MTARAFSGAELAARLWAELSPFPNERGVAGRKYRELARVVPDDELRLAVVGEIAVDRLHATALTHMIARHRAAAIAFRRRIGERRENAERVAAMIASLASRMRMPA